MSLQFQMAYYGSRIICSFNIILGLCWIQASNFPNSKKQGGNNNKNESNSNNNEL